MINLKKTDSFDNQIISLNSNYLLTLPISILRKYNVFLQVLMFYNLSYLTMNITRI